MILKTFEVAKIEYEVIYRIPEETEKEVIQDLQKHLDILSSKPFDESVSRYIQTLLDKHGIESIDSDQTGSAYDFEVTQGIITKEEIEW